MRKINSIKKYLFFLLFVFVAGCVPQAQGPAFKKALAPAGDRELVYMYRLSGHCAGALSYQLSINKRSITTIPNGGVQK